MISYIEIIIVILLFFNLSYFKNLFYRIMNIIKFKKIEAKNKKRNAILEEYLANKYYKGKNLLDEYHKLKDEK